MKHFKLLLVLTTFLAFSCSKDDEETQPQSLENATFQLAEDQQTIEIPEGLQNSENQYAQMAAQWVASMNNMTAYYQYFEVPEGAEKLSSPIVVSNSRVAATTEEYLVYSYEYNGLGIAYQVHAEGDYYIFEIFIKWEAGEDWSPYVYVKQHKTLYEGTMKVYLGTSYDDIVAEYEWEQDGDMLYMSGNLFNSFIYEIAYNQSTEEGQVEAFSEGDLVYHIEWDGAGNGSYVYYDSDGETLQSGSWEV